MTDTAKLSDEELEARRSELAEERTRVRLAQNEVQAEIDLRAALSSMSGPVRRIVEIRLGGTVTPEGKVSA